MVGMGVGGHQQVDPADAERGQLGGDLLGLGPPVHQHGGAPRRTQEGGIALSDVEERHGEVARWAGSDGAGPDEDRHDQDEHDHGPPGKGRGP